MFLSRICWLYGINLFCYNSLNMLTLPVLPINTLREISIFFSLGDSYQAKITQVIRSFLVYEKFPSLLYLLVLFSRSIKEKRTVSKAKSLLVRGLEISPKKSSAKINAPTFCHENSMARDCADSPKLNLSDLI